MSDDMERVAKALGGDNEEQRRIASVGLTWVATLLRKNADYGSSVWREPVLAPGLDCGAVIRVRMSDKVARLASLLKPGAGGPEIKAETVDDTFADLGAYCLLYLARPGSPKGGDA